MSEPLYTAAEARAAEERYPGYPGTAPELMERAGAAVARELMARYPKARHVAVVCGGGSNGGDGRIAARILREAGIEAIETEAVEGADVIVDAVFGTGFHGAPRSDAAATIERLNAAGPPIVSVDMPSGVDASTGEVAGAAVRAALTVTFHGRKVGLVVAPGRFHTGEVVVADIGLEPVSTEHSRADETLLADVPRRGDRDSKYTSGSVLVVGGAPGLTGAACLAAMAAFRADAGYVAIAVPAESLAAVEAQVLEPVKLTWEQIDDALPRAQAVAIGPGLGRSAAARALVTRLLREVEVPLVLDADALYELDAGGWAAPAVLTPHAGELARLLGTTSEWVGAHRLEAARAAADRYGAVCLLKGADTIIAAPDAGVVVADLGPPSLAVAGTGDVLTGVLASFLAKGMAPSTAAIAAALAHGLAARLVPAQRGLVAGDIVAALPLALG